MRELEVNELGVRNYNKKKKNDLPEVVGVDVPTRDVKKGTSKDSPASLFDASPLGVPVKDRNRPTKEDGTFGKDLKKPAMKANKGGPLDDLEEVSSLDEGDIQNGGLKKAIDSPNRGSLFDSNEDLLVPKSKKFRRKAPRDS